MLQFHGMPSLLMIVLLDLRSKLIFIIYVKPIYGQYYD